MTNDERGATNEERRASNGELDRRDTLHRMFAAAIVVRYSKFIVVRRWSSEIRRSSC
jgi:hypothetical protein